MKIAAFDLGTTWAVATNDLSQKAILLGLDAEAAHMDLNPGRTKPKLKRQRPEVLGRFAECLAHGGGILEGFDVVVYERPFARGQGATRLLWGMAGILEAAAHNAGVAVLDMTPGEIKLWATGKGNAGKPEMIAAAQRLGYTGDNEHEADAYCLLKFAEATLSKE